MSTAGLGAPAVARPRADDSLPHPHLAGPGTAATAAWLCAIPCMVVAAVAASVLGPPLGQMVSPSPAAYTFFPDFAVSVQPESTEQARYLVALSLPLLIAAATIASHRWRPQTTARGAALAATAAQAFFAGLLVACYVAQTQRVFGGAYLIRGQVPFQMRYFTAATLVAAALIATATLLVIRTDSLRRAAAQIVRDSRARRAGGLVAAVVATAIWMLHAVQSDGSLAHAQPDVRFHVAFPLDEAFAVLNGLSPLVDFSAQYGSLWPYLSATLMLAFGKTLLVFSLAMCTLTGLALLAVYDVLRRVARSAVAALLLYLPFLATSLFLISEATTNRTTVGSFFSTFPLRYAIPYVLALLTARHIERGGRSASAWLLFVVGGLAILNNGDFGVAAFGATLAALVWSAQERSQRSLLHLAATAGAGLLTALALVSLLTLLRAGSLPHLERLTDFARLFAGAGFGMMPVPSLLGMQLVVYLTFVAAIVVATVRALERAPDRLLTGMLVWAGVFGLGVGSYYVGRSHPITLKSTFSAWALALALLTVVVVRATAASPSRRPTIATVAVLFGVGLAACSLAQASAPWTQFQRLSGLVASSATSSPLVPPTNPRIRTFISSLADGADRFVVRRGAPVAIMTSTGHRIADAYGVRNVTPYTGIDSMPTRQFAEAALDALAKAGGNTVILPNPVDRGIFEVLERRGFRLLTRHGLRRYDPSVPHGDAVLLDWPHGTVLKWVDTRNLHPRVLDP